MVERWNAIVRPQDKVYHLGDVVINKKSLHHVSRLNGHKKLVRGNHDIFQDQMYRDVGFESIYGVRVLADMILSHIPLHPESITHRFNVNVHGHLHANEVMLNNIPDPRYLCVSVEHTNYAPLSIDEVRQRIKDRHDAIGYQAPKGWGNGSEIPS